MLILYVVTLLSVRLSAAVFTLVSLLVIFVAVLCLVQLHTRLLDKFLPNTTPDVDDWSEEPIDDHLALQTVRDFKFRFVPQKLLCKAMKNTHTHVLIFWFLTHLFYIDYELVLQLNQITLVN